MGGWAGGGERDGSGRGLGLDPNGGAGEGGPEVAPCVNKLDHATISTIRKTVRVRAFLNPVSVCLDIEASDEGCTYFITTDQKVPALHQNDR